MARRPRTWITDMGHFLDGAMLADMPAPATDVALHLGAIVAWVSSHAPAPLFETNVRCRTRTRADGRCVGDIHASIGPDDTIEWLCIVCRESGRISGWRQTPWDRSSRPR
jgi:hypothetical protein